METKPGEKRGWVIWFEPTWQCRDGDQVLAGSRQAYDEEDGGFDQAAEEVWKLVDRQVTAIEIDPISNDLRVDLSGGFSVRTFVCDPRDDLLWHIKNWSTGRRIEGTPSGIEHIEA